MVNKIYYYCPDIKTPSAGVQRLYRHVAILSHHGFCAYILHQNNGFSRKEDYEVPICYLNEVKISANDIFVVPEVCPQLMKALSKSTSRTFVIALNWDYVFRSLPAGTAWKDYNVERALVISPFVGRMISWTMNMPVHLIDSSIDFTLYKYDSDNKKPNVVYIHRKAPNIDLLMKILAAHNADYINKVNWRPLSGLTRSEYAKEIQNAAIFLNLSPAEGYPTSCLEAMAAGALVVGFDSMGGRGILNNGVNCVLAQNGDYVTLAYDLAPLLDELIQGRSLEWERKILRGIKSVSHLTIGNEVESVIRFWSDIISSGSKESYRKF